MKKSILSNRRRFCRNDRRNQAAATTGAALSSGDGLQTSGQESDPGVYNGQTYVDHCNKEYGIPDMVDFGLMSMVSGDGSIIQDSPQEQQGLPMARLRHPKGSSVDICLHGAAVTRWETSDGANMLYVKSSNRFDGEEPIKGGITWAWPQLGYGKLPCSNGVLQYLHWSVVETSAWKGTDDPRPSITLYADVEDVSMSPVSDSFSHPFEVLATITLGIDEEDARQREDEARAHRIEKEKMQAEDADSDENGKNKKSRKKDADHSSGSEDEEAEKRREEPVFELICELTVLNKSEEKDLTFTAGALANFATESLLEYPETVKINGLIGKYVLDYSKDPMRPALTIENDHFVKFDAKKKENVEKLYVDCPKEGEVLFCPGVQRHYDVKNIEGFKDILVQHFVGSEPEESCNFISIAAARKARPVRLKPGDVWSSQAKFLAYDRYWDISELEMEEHASGIPVPPRERALPPMRRDGSRM
eukprot:jgi/Picsp_1/5632/NSC_02991-R1_protein